MTTSSGSMTACVSAAAMRVAYLCHGNRVALPWLAGTFATVPRDLSDLLLIDVEAGIRERASRIDEAVSAVQTFIRRARLRLEPAWNVTPEFARLWDREFASFRVWQASKKRHLYKENWIEWDELETARRVEAFRFLEERLKSAELTVAVPGGLQWWPDQRPREEPRTLEPLQDAEASRLTSIATQPEGLTLLRRSEARGQALVAGRGSDPERRWRWRQRRQRPARNPLPRHPAQHGP